MNPGGGGASRGWRHRARCVRLCADASADTFGRAAVLASQSSQAMLQPDALEKVRKEAYGWTPTATLPWRSRGGQPVAIAAPFLADLDAKEEEFHFLSGIANREESYAICDELTRKTGRLTKLVIIQVRA